ncbi:hypothetical protein [Chitinophaga sp. MM2321]|uniref:hypothetical protein n=1 Tax=Chitinophaga sp. MM2321 TaxID=3137178 RepID=UPI0032D58A88
MFFCVMALLWAVMPLNGQDKPVAVNWADSVQYYNGQLQVNYAKAQLVEYTYHVYTYNHLIKAYDLHHRNSNIIFWMVLIIVGAGLIFSGIQFFISLKSFNFKIRHNKKVLGTTEQQDTATEDKPTTFKLSKDGIEFSSSIFGVIILAMSIIFFYFYLHFVYPINVDTGQPTGKQVDVPPVATAPTQ